MTRRRYRWDDETQSLVEVAADAPVTPRLEIQTGNHYEGARATDGTPIDTKRKHAEYMKRHGLAMADDFKQTWAEAPKRREAERRAELRDTIGRTIHKLENRRR